MGIYHVVSKKFCCCLPVRIGVFVLSVLGVLSGAYTSWAIWTIVANTAKNGTFTDNVNKTNSSWDSIGYVTYDKGQFYMFIAVGVIAGIYTLFSLAGLIGAIFRKRGLVAVYSTALWSLLFAHLSLGVYVIIMNNRQRNAIETECKDAAGAINDAAAICHSATSIGIGVAIAVLVVQLIVNLYCCIIVKRYVEQLSEEQAFTGYTAGNRVSKGGYEPSSSYYPHAPLQQQHELGPYPYSASGAAFTSKA